MANRPKIAARLLVGLALLLVAGALVLAMMATNNWSPAAVAKGNNATETPPNATKEQNSGTRVKISNDRHELFAVLNDSPTARDFLSLLPMTIAMKDYSGSAKISYPDRKLSAAGAPAGVAPAVGGFTYYAPYGDIAIWYTDSAYVESLIQLGEITEGLENLKHLEGQVTFEAVADR